jgi:hypothetical protein
MANKFAISSGELLQTTGSMLSFTKEREGNERLLSM